MKELKRITEGTDFEEYFKIKSDKNAILWSGFSSAPDREKLRQHFDKIIQDDNVFLYYLVDSDNGEVIGYDQMVKVDDCTVESTGHSIKSEYARRGFGNLLFELLVIEARKLKFKRFIGWISEYNIGSIKNVEHSGFVRSYTPFKLVKLESLGREDRFYMYERTL